MSGGVQTAMRVHEAAGATELLASTAFLAPVPVGAPCSQRAAGVITGVCWQTGYLDPLGSKLPPQPPSAALPRAPSGGSRLFDEASRVIVVVSASPTPRRAAFW